jgi:CRP/FNR family transcriptional regulator, cyclic AMP receptor protein
MDWFRGREHGASERLQGRQARTAKITQETLAKMIGTTRSRVSHFMNKFLQLNFIDYNGHLEVHSSLLGVVLNEETNNVERAPQ